MQVNLGRFGHGARARGRLRLPPSLTHAALLLALGAAFGCEHGSKAAKGEDPVPVTLAAVQLVDVPREVQAFGVVEASSTVDVRAQVQGLITQVHFHEGDFVKRGDLLFSVDTRPYSASLAAAQAELLRNKAVADQAAVEAERAARLRQEGVASDQEVNRAEADARSTAANVKVGQAQIQSASINVAFGRITSPLDGRTGSLLVHAGNIVKATDAQPLVVIRSLSPVFVRFSVPQDHVAVIREQLGKGSLVARVTPRGDNAKSIEAPVTFLDNTVDVATGTVSLKATYANTEQLLWPGASVDVVLVLGVDRQATVVPEAALSRSQTGTLVFVIGPDGRAEPRPVEVLRTTATQALIRSGLEAGEEVVTDGQLRLRKGTKVSRKQSAKAVASAEAPGKKPEGP
jgi:multidrug efflux system membrane fusion protein